MPNLATRGRGRLAEVPPLHALLLAVAVACLVVRARGFLPFMADDAFISLRYARRLLDGHGLTWTDGQRVEGYSNLLWVLACAGLARLGIGWVFAARCLGVAATLGSLVALTWFARSLPLLACAAGLAVVAGAGPSAVWAIGGLEQPLLALWVVLGTISALPLVDKAVELDGRSKRQAWSAGVFFALAALTRPDGCLFGGAVVLALLLAQRPDRTRAGLALRLASVVLGTVLAQLLFRVVYYGDFIPNTGRAKVSLGTVHIVRGCYYVWEGMVAQRTLFVPALAALVLVWRRGSRPRLVLIVAPVIVWLGYLATVGGDIFPAWRQMVPVLGLVALLLAEGVAATLSYGATARWLAAVVLVNAAALGVYDERQDKQLQQAHSERWEWNGEVTGRFLARAFAASAPLLAVDSAGCIPFFSGLPALDMLGLNDAFLGHHPPSSFGNTGSIGHELGNGAYVLAQKPDLVVFCLPMGSDKPCFRSGREMVQSDDFRGHYQLVAFEGGQPFASQSLVWVRRDSPKIGIQRTADRVTVPGFLLGDSDTLVARLDGDGRVVVELAAHGRAALPELDLPAGAWRLTVEADAATLGVSVDDGPAREGPAAGQTVLLTEHAHIALESPGAQPVHVRGLVLSRAPVSPTAAEAAR